MRKLIKSFGYALQGISYLIRTQRNFRIHLVCAFLAMVAALLLRFTMAEWGVLFVVIGLVISSEAFNTAIERAVDCATEEFTEKAKQAKDTAAAAVLLMAVTALLVGVVLFLSKIIKLLR